MTVLSVTQHGLQVLFVDNDNRLTRVATRMHVSQCLSGGLQTTVPMFTTRDLAFFDQRDDLIEEAGEHMRGLSLRDDETFHSKGALEDFFEVLKLRS